MRIIFSVHEDSEDIRQEIEENFGRCPFFLQLDLDEGLNIKDKEIIKNPGAEQEHGAGLKAAGEVIGRKPDFVVAGRIGPKAEDVLKEAGLEFCEQTSTVEEALYLFRPERILFPLSSDEGMDSRISEHFGHAPYFGVYTQKDGIQVFPELISHQDPERTPVDQVMEKVNPTMVFAIGIGQRAKALFEEKGVKVLTGSYTTVEEVIENIEGLYPLTNSCSH